ncbi:MAG: MlaE family lipid ABC transporter permease subunit [Planctomycetes bacterium]|nr:MlaE family lipid ABC transporter permease subunit [Planctomycetota bacterium]MCB9903885.1 MlaE family lipid ABC transporter permease subunit [Planctomycetota bacterium]
MGATTGSGRARAEVREEDGVLVLALAGHLDAAGTAEVWRPAESALAGLGSRALRLDASGVDYADGSGTALLFDCLQRAKRKGGGAELVGASHEVRSQLELHDPELWCEQPAPERKSDGLIVEVGRATTDAWKEARELIEFTGAVAIALKFALLNPRSVRWRDVVRVSERAGVNALPIIAIIGSLMGLILAFQSAIPMKKFGADLFVADLVAISLLRELGPLMTAIVLCGRSGSAFAAELGTMKVNEEVDALTTMGLEPVRFLVVPRVLAAVMTTPMLAVFANLCGLIGGAVVFLSFGHPLVSYYRQVQGAVTHVDLLGGIFKAFTFGVIVAAVGCARGLQTGHGASAVGLSTTRSVVSGILLIVIADMAFALLYYALDI